MTSTHQKLAGCPVHFVQGTVEALDRVGGVDNTANIHGVIKNRDDVFPMTEPDLITAFLKLVRYEKCPELLAPMETGVPRQARKCGLFLPTDSTVNQGFPL
jgi:hypothetical protein